MPEVWFRRWCNFVSQPIATANARSARPKLSWYIVVVFRATRTVPLKPRVSA
jgi:hypothetical protein